MAEPAPICPVCRGTGFAIQQRDGAEVAVRCSCRRGRSPESLLAGARIPPRYQHCSIQGFEVWVKDPGTQRIQSQAKRRTQEFVDCYPGVERGLLFMGSVGTGKTHLAVAALRELVGSKGVQGLYVNAVELVQALQMSFDGKGSSREEILGPVTETDLVVFDEIGAGRPTDWVQDLLYYVINSRYMARRITILTTNYLDVTGGAEDRFGLDAPGRLDAVVASGRFKPAPYGETLADRISARLRSRLFEMADVIELGGEDYRARKGGQAGRKP